MLSFYNIFTVARFEIKTLFRSWFFRIFAGLAIFILFWFNFGILTVGEVPLTLRGLPACVPYMNLLLLNAAQAVIAVFLASDFLKRDKKLDTTEVIYMRSMTNGDYVLGKTLGIFLVFIALNVIMLIIAAVFNLIAPDVSIHLGSYLTYPLLISVPTLIFIFGLSFFFMVVIRNQAVTFIVLLGYIAMTLFFLSEKLHHVFDYMAFNVPLMYSDFVGFGNLTEVLIHRGIYLFLGLAFIFATIRLLKRLPQSVMMQRLSLVFIVIFGGVSFWLAGVYLSHIHAGNRLRQEMMALNDEWVDAARVSLQRSDIHLSHEGEKIDCSTRLVFQNLTEKDIDRIVFRLNPGLLVDRIESRGKEISFEREHHLLFIEPGDPLAPQSVDSLTVFYRGVIDEDACYLDADAEIRERDYRVWMYQMDKRHAFITPNYVLLTPETGWYPLPGVSFSPRRPQERGQDFIRFTLRVSTRAGLTAFCQGEVTGEGNGSFIFQPEVVLPQLSLVIGDYEKRSIAVDSVEYNLLTMRDHDYFVPYLSELGDTLSFLIRDMKQDFENRIELTYPYRRFSLVEVPVQFLSYPRIWTETMETVQPEMVFLPERGVMMPGADFRQSIRRLERRMERSNQVITPSEIQSNALRRFATSTLMDESMGGRFDEDELPSIEKRFTIYSNYHGYVTYLRSEKWPLLNGALESFISKRMENPMVQFRRTFTGLTDDEKVNLALVNQNLTELLKDPGKKEMIDDVLKTKGNYLFSQIQSEVGEENFKAFLNEILSANRFRALEAETFARMLEDRYGIDFETLVEDWYTSSTLPGFLITHVDGYKVLDGNRTRYQVRFTVTNPEMARGLLNVSFRMGGGGPGGRGGPGGFFGMGGGGDSEVERMIKVGSGQTKSVGIVLDAMPRMMSINTMISRNLPSVFNEMFEEFELKQNVTPFDGEEILEQPPAISNPDEIIVDNEDPGFRAFNPVSQSPLKKLLRITHEEEEQYEGIRFWRPSREWRATTNSDYYGKYIRSAHHVRSGEGDKKVEWKAPIPQSGYYDLYVFNANTRLPGRGRGGGPGRGRRDERGQYHFIVTHDEGVDETIFDRKDAEDGWNFLGTYYLSADTAKVELTNESEERIVFADAIKWVKH